MTTSVISHPVTRAGTLRTVLPADLLADERFVPGMLESQPRYNEVVLACARTDANDGPSLMIVFVANRGGEHAHGTRIVKCTQIFYGGEPAWKVTEVVWIATPGTLSSRNAHM